MAERISERWRQFRRWLFRYCRLADVLDFLLLGCACVLAINTLSVSEWVTVLFGGGYLALLAVRLAITIRERRAIDRLQGEVLWGLFDMLNDEFFGGECYARFTLFKADPADDRAIIPWYRYAKAEHHPITTAQRSRARYKRGEGLTGTAWAESGNNGVTLEILPKFSNRQEFEDYYVNTLGIDAFTVRDISNYMVNVGCILSFGFADTRGHFLAVLSIDLQWDFTNAEPLAFSAPDGQTRTLDTNTLATVWLITHNVLRSYAHALPQG